MSLRWPSWLVQGVPEGHPDALGSLDALERGTWEPVPAERATA